MTSTTEMNDNDEYIGTSRRQSGQTQKRLTFYIFF